MLRLIKRLIKLPVRTASGIALGHVMDFEMDTDTGRIQAVRIKPSGMMKGLMKEELCVGWSQIIEIREDVVIVDDSVSKESVASAVRSTASASLIMASED